MASVFFSFSFHSSRNRSFFHTIYCSSCWLVIGGAKRHLINVTRAQFANRQKKKMKSANLSVILHSQIACGQLKLIEFENAGVLRSIWTLPDFSFVFCALKLDQLTAHTMWHGKVVVVGCHGRTATLHGAYYLFTHPRSHSMLCIHIV